MTDRIAPAAHPIEPALAARWSPRSFEDRAVPDAALAQVLEAARWAAPRTRRPIAEFTHLGAWGSLRAPA